MGPASIASGPHRLSVSVSHGPQPNWLSFVEHGTDQQVDIHVVKNAGQDPVVTVTNDNHAFFSAERARARGLGRESRR